MGYAIATPIASRRLQTMMMDFIEVEYRHFDVFAGLGPKTRCIRGPMTEEELIYDGGKCRIGFEYGVGGRDREWGHVFVRWLARKVGRRRRFKGIPEAVPYYVYDGYEASPVLPLDMEVDEKWRWAKVGRRCLVWDRIYYRGMPARVVEHYRNVNQTMGMEIDRLNWKWRQWVLEQ